MKKVLIVGSGITSALTSYLLRQKLLTDLIHITIWDKARGPGGRMTTSRSNVVPNCKVDLGLQYITTTPDFLSNHTDIYQPLLDEKLLEPFTANIIGYKSRKKNVTHYVTPQGSSSIVKYFLNKSNIDEICYNTFLETMSKTESTNQIEVTSKEGKKGIFDIVVLSMPAPQVTDLFNRSEMMHIALTGAAQVLLDVEYSSRYAFGMFFDKQFERPFDIKYFDDNEIIRYISFDNVKRNRPDEPISVCVHTTTQYYNSFLDSETPRNVIERELLDLIRKMFPSWPLPAETKLQTWKYSQVVDPHRDKLGYMQFSAKPLVICIGDSYVPQSNFDGCIHSAKQSVEVLLKGIQS